MCTQASELKQKVAEHRAHALAAKHDKADVSKFDLGAAVFGNGDDFYKGLEVVGVPHSRIREAMMREWVESKDSKVEFESWNSGKRVSTPLVEWFFVVEPFEWESVCKRLPPSAWKHRYDYGGRCPLRLKVLLHATCATRAIGNKVLVYGDYKHADALEREHPLWLHADEVSMVKVVLLRFVKSQVDGTSLSAAFQPGKCCIEDKDAAAKADKVAAGLKGYLDKTDGPQSESTLRGAVEALQEDGVASEAELEALIDYFHTKLKRRQLTEAEVIGMRMYTGPG